MAKKEKVNPELQKLQKRFQQAQQQFLGAQAGATSEYQEKLKGYDIASKAFEEKSKAHQGALEKYLQKEYLPDAMSYFPYGDGYFTPSASYNSSRTYWDSRTGRLTAAGQQLRDRLVSYGLKPRYSTGLDFNLPDDFDWEHTGTSPGGEVTYGKISKRLGPNPGEFAETAPGAPQMADLSAARQKLGEEEQYFKRETGERKLAGVRARRRTQERPLLAGEKV